MTQTFNVHGTMTLFEPNFMTFSGTADPTGRPPSPPAPPEPPPPAGDQIKFSQAEITAQSPDVRGWPIGATLTRVGLSFDHNMELDFSKRNGPGAWPFVIGAEGGEIQYTLWLGCKIADVWRFAASILCISRGVDDNYVPTGPTLSRGQLPNNWYYFTNEPLRSYQPQPGEQVAWFLTSGVQRRTDIHQIAERTQVVLTPFSPGVYAFTA